MAAPIGPGRSPEDVLSGLTFEDSKGREVVGFTDIQVNEAWREFVRTYAQQADAARLTSGFGLQIGGNVTPTISLETLLGLPGGAGMPGSFRVLANVTGRRIFRPNGTDVVGSGSWYETGGEGSALDWPEGTSHVRPVGLTYRTTANLTGYSLPAEQIISGWAYTVPEGGGLEQFNDTRVSALAPQYGSNGVLVALQYGASFSAPYYPVERFPNGWVFGLYVAVNNSQFLTGALALDFDVI